MSENSLTDLTLSICVAIRVFKFSVQCGLGLLVVNVWGNLWKGYGEQRRSFGVCHCGWFWALARLGPGDPLSQPPGCGIVHCVPVEASALPECNTLQSFIFVSVIQNVHFLCGGRMCISWVAWRIRLALSFWYHLLIPECAMWVVQLWSEGFGWGHPVPMCSGTCWHSQRHGIEVNLTCWMGLCVCQLVPSAWMCL